MMRPPSVEPGGFRREQWRDDGAGASVRDEFTGDALPGGPVIEGHFVKRQVGKLGQGEPRGQRTGVVIGVASFPGVREHLRHLLAGQRLNFAGDAGQVARSFLIGNLQMKAAA